MELCLWGGGERGSGGAGGGLIIDSRGVMQKKESSEFRFPEFGISAVVRCSLVWFRCSYFFLVGIVVGIR